MRYYTIQISENMCNSCYDNYCLGLCKASFANSPLDLKDKTTGKITASNAKFFISHHSDPITIRIQTIQAIKEIEAHSEIFYSYGNYKFPSVYG
jgi:hypothetical protein